MDTIVQYIICLDSQTPRYLHRDQTPPYKAEGKYATTDMAQARRFDTYSDAEATLAPILRWAEGAHVVEIADPVDPPDTERPSADTPWGKPQFTTKVAPGIWWHTCAGHGGFEVSPKRFEEMPDFLRKCAFTYTREKFPRFFEEDAAFCAVPLAFYTAFTAEQVATAFRTLRMLHKDKVEAYLRWAAQDEARAEVQIRANI